MGFRFSRRISLFPGVSLNLGKKGASVSVGPRGAKVTIGPRGVKSSVGIPGTGVRYETPYSKIGGGGGSNVDFGGGWWVFVLILAVICGIAFYIAYQYGRYSESSIPVMVMVGTGASAIVCFFVALGMLVDANGNHSENGQRISPERARWNRWNAYLREMAQASQAFFDFVKELNRSTRCRNLLQEQQGLEPFDSEKSAFAVTQRLGAIVYCDVRDCFRRLGHSTESLYSIEGMGYAMFMSLLIVKGFDVNQFFDPRQAREMAKAIGNLERIGTCEVNIRGHEKESRFSVIFGMVNGEHEWVQKYSTLLYRWASLIAKADGTVSQAESDTLAAIMNMKTSSNTTGDVHVRNSGSVPRIGRTENDANDLTSDSGNEPSEAKGPQSLTAAMKELDDLIGLEPVKSEVHRLVSFTTIQKKRAQVGLKAAPVSYHCVFTGNPGTGKTTVARILADIYRALGVLKKGHLIETDRSGLVGEYVGQTAVKTNKVIDSALDGVLFIDEAYSLIQGGEKDYGREAIATLLKRMEDDRDRLIVILAGYTNEMQRFIDSNPGLQSRFNRYIEFPDYSAEELAQIFLRSVEKNQYVCNQDVKDSITSIMELAVAKKERSFGNARYVRNLFENAIQRQAVRLSTVAPLTSQMLTELTLHDLGFAYE